MSAMADSVLGYSPVLRDLIWVLYFFFFNAVTWPVSCEKRGARACNEL